MIPLKKQIFEGAAGESRRKTGDVWLKNFAENASKIRAKRVMWDFCVSFLIFSLAPVDGSA